MHRLSVTAHARLSWLAVALWATVIFGFSSLEGSQMGGVNVGGWGHFVEFAVLGGLLMNALGNRGTLLAAVAIASAYGVTDELHQLFVPGRTTDPVDWLVDTLGALAGALIARWLLTRRDQRPNVETEARER